ncbi:MAG: DNA repair protein RecN [Alphaproteobacteria bacterium]|nr:DNA repair protein RecN [Alphaproteobacteria bacterium]
MLKSLSIRNVVLIDKLDVDFDGGFSVLSGETGAGKSILLDSVGLVLGRRAETDKIRKDCDKLTVCASFAVDDADGSIRELCRQYDLEYDHEVIIKRSLDRDGKGKIFFNDQPITQKLLKEIGAHLIEIHGQFDNQGLLNVQTHQKVLDEYGHLLNLKNEVKEKFTALKKAEKARAELENRLEAAQKNLENLHHWLAEFEKVKPQKGELENLEDKRRQMMNAEKILENLDGAYQALNGTNQSVRDCLRGAQAHMAKVNALTNKRFADIYQIIDVALINTEEAMNEIDHASREIQVDQEDLNNIEQRLFILKSLARKHNTTVDELPNVWRQMKEDVAQIEFGADDLQALRQREKQCREEYETCARMLSRQRQLTAAKLDEAVMRELPALKMEKARFMTQITEKNADSWDEDGTDEVNFVVATNIGSEFGPLNKIASGGELARFMLALKVNLAQSSQVETMIFDEVDSGIGGATATAVGEKLAKLGQNVQVLVVTHSPQVASCASAHYKVEKMVDGENTKTFVRLLDQSEKLEEIARMLSGEKISDEARAAANVLLKG